MIGPLNCKEVTTRLALGDLRQYVWADRFMIRFHLAICWVCRKYERQLKVIGLAYQAVLDRRRQTASSTDFKERLQHKLRKVQ